MEENFYDPKYYKHLESVYRDKNSLMSKKLNLVISLLPKGKKFLDVGCGTGELLFRLRNKYNILYGIDLSRSSIKFAKKKTSKCKNIKLINSTIENFKSKEFDAVTALDVLEHLDNPETALKKIRSMLKKNGVLIATFPNFYEKLYTPFYKLIGKVNLHKHSHSIIGWSRIFRKCGFEILYARAVDFPVIHSNFFAKKLKLFGMCPLLVCKKK